MVLSARPQVNALEFQQFAGDQKLSGSVYPKKYRLPFSRVPRQMLLSKSAPGFFIEISEHTFAVARCASLKPPFVIEEIRTCPVEKASEIVTIMGELQPKRRGANRLTHAVCGVYPNSGFVRRAVLDPKRMEEQGYLDEAVTTNCRVNPSEYMLAAVSAKTGVDVHQSAEKDVLFAGMSIVDVSAVQKRLLSLGIYPERLELGTLATLGAVMDYRASAGVSTPTLLLEMRQDTIQSFVVAENGVEVARQISQGIDSMIPVIQKELGLKDEESARRLFLSNTFDFTGMAAAFTKKLIKELQSSIGFYEVQTGQSIGQVLCTNTPAKLNWLQSAIASQLGVESLDINLASWLTQAGVSLPPKLQTEVGKATHLMGLFSLMLNHGNAAIRKQSR